MVLMMNASMCCLFGSHAVLNLLPDLRWATGTSNMGQSAQYPIYFGRAIALSFEISGNYREALPQIMAFVKDMVDKLPPPGTLLPEVARLSRSTRLLWKKHPVYFVVMSVLLAKHIYIGIKVPWSLMLTVSIEVEIRNLKSMIGLSSVKSPFLQMHETKLIRAMKKISPNKHY